MTTFIFWCGMVYIFWEPVRKLVMWLGNYPLPEWLNTVAILFFLGFVPYLAVMALTSIGSMLIYQLALLTT